jgi:hypothetical protein
MQNQWGERPKEVKKQNPKGENKKHPLETIETKKTQKKPPGISN